MIMIINIVPGMLLIIIRLAIANLLLLLVLLRLRRCPILRRVLKLVLMLFHGLILILIPNSLGCYCCGHAERYCYPKYVYRCCCCCCCCCY